MLKQVCCCFHNLGEEIEPLSADFRRQTKPLNRYSQLASPSPPPSGKFAGRCSLASRSHALPNLEALAWAMQLGDEGAGFPHRGYSWDVGAVASMAWAPGVGPAFCI